VLVAVAYEARSLQRRLARSGDARSTALTIRAVGIGATGLAEIERDLAAERPAAVLVTGVAGGLDPGIEPGDLVVAREVGPEPGGGWLSPDLRLVRRAVTAAGDTGLRVRSGRLLTVPRVLAGPDAKAEAWRRHAALAVDMESVPVLAWAAGLGLPALAVRAVADGPHEALPSALAGAVGAGGAVRPGVVLGWVRHPTVVAAGWRLWSRSRLALDRLGSFLVAFTRHPFDL
jgi:nucleoside phosphorylase